MVYQSVEVITGFVTFLIVLTGIIGLLNINRNFFLRVFNAFILINN